MSQITVLLKKLNEEISEDMRVVEFIDDLQMFEDNRGQETIVGLKNKLEKVNRGDEVSSANQKKEHFAKLLAKMTHFPSAQKIFAYFLSRIHDVFEAHIMHQGSVLARHDVEAIIEEKIIQPTLSDMGSDCEHLTLSHMHIRGMIFWLADKCYVRWH